MAYIKWDVGSYCPDKVQKLSESLGISSLAARVLCSRGICDEVAARAFLDTKSAAFHDPLLLRDMDLALERIEMALEDGEKIAVYGDYDVDGITATYILSDYLQSLGADCVYYIPERDGEGYGVNVEAVEKLRNEGVSLIVTVDTGITAVAEVEAAREMGVDFIITDHHECQSMLPDACAVINPHRPDCDYPEKNLAGVGVAFKLICALEEGIAEQYLPFVCIGTIADVMPLIGENRVIAAQGLSRIENSRNPGLGALVRLAGAEGKVINADTIGFQLAPRINAAGRMSSASRVVELFTVGDYQTAESLAEELCSLNVQRREIEADIFKEASEKVDREFDLNRDYALVIQGRGWHHGVLGIVASRICEKYQRPAVLISVDEGEGKGSGRSVKGVNLFRALSSCGEYLQKFGGHEQAAGLSIAEENIDAFRKALNREIEEEMKIYQPSMHIDFEAQPGELTIEEVRSLRVLEPYGTGNPRPVIKLSNMRACDITPIGAGKHLRMTFERQGKFQSVFFGKTERDIGFENGAVVDVVFVPEINDFRGENVQLMLRDARPVQSEELKELNAVQCYRSFRNGEALSEDETNVLKVQYNDLGAVWRYIAKCGKIKDTPLEELCSAVNSVFNRNLSKVKIIIAMDIFKELGLLEYKSRASRISVTVCGQIQRVDLRNSQTARRLGCIGNPAQDRERA